VSRELAGNRDGAMPGYDATRAAAAYHMRRERCVRRRKLAAGSALYQHVHDHLVYWRWSPQQIAAGLRCMYPDNSDQRVSHETIYAPKEVPLWDAAIYAHRRGGHKQAMIEALHQEKPARGRRRTSIARAGFVPEELRIVHRPEEIELRQWPGHWEGVYMATLPAANRRSRSRVSGAASRTSRPRHRPSPRMQRTHWR
jgi:IS30 family transposase